MTESEQIAAFEDEVIKVIERFRHEFHLHYVSMIGVLHLQAHVLTVEALDENDPKHTD